jgi:hypothetical protein
MPDWVRESLMQQPKDFYAAGFDAMIERWDKCINVGGGYVEKYFFFPGSNITCFTFYIHFHLVGGGVQLDPLGTAATDWPIVACPG